MHHFTQLGFTDNLELKEEESNRNRLNTLLMLKIETTLKIKKNQAIMYWIIVVKVRIASYGTATNIKLFIRNTQRYSCLTRR
ncbi:unnamed protein product [Porites lobata]|uniref:Uncharacterized protein n=1 Tax=Porites lobata TaxID=104759 RepID=A0ABN8SDP6_9CNID|nr:unnamed protein product [Porites lobata]